MKGRKFFLTVNNYSPQEWWDACDIVHKCKYGICCKEVGELGTPHIHIWVHFENARTFNSIQKKFKRANIQQGMGRDSDQVYLKKGGDFVEFGEPEKQGQRNDIHKVKEVISAGGGMKEIIEEVNSYQAIRGGELLLKYLETPREIKPIEVIWFYGKAGTGKTKTVFDTEVNPFTPTTFKWWEGYDGHKVVLVDDWRPTWCSFVDLLRLTDIYPFRIQNKGGSRQVKYNKIYFTSDGSPLDYFSNLPEDELEQLNRRITLLKCFDTEVEG